MVDTMNRNYPCCQQLNAQGVVCGLLISMLLLSGSAALLGQQIPAREAPVRSGESVCRAEVLPIEIQARLNQEFAAFKIQHSENLDREARGRWESEKSAACPGIAIGAFEGRFAVAYAVLLVPREKTKRGYRFVVFRRAPGEQHFGGKVLEQSDEGNGADLFIEKVPISKFFDRPSRVKFKVAADVGILFLDTGQKEYEADVYYWAQGEYKHDPVDY